MTLKMTQPSTSTLSKSQNDLVEAIFSLQNSLELESSLEPTNSLELRGSAQQQAGLAIYQNNMLANGRRALSITFAYTSKLLGLSNFNQLADLYLTNSLKTQYDWGEYGKDFPEFIEQNTELSSTEHELTTALVAELARFDLNLHQATRAINIEPDLTTLALLEQVDAYQLTILLASGSRVFQCQYDIVGLARQLDNIESQGVDLHQQTMLENLQQLGDKSLLLPLTDKAMESDLVETSQCVFIWRPMFKAQFETVTQSQYLWLQKQLQQQSIGAALDELIALERNDFSLLEWLPKAIQQEQLTSIKKLN